MQRDFLYKTHTLLGYFCYLLQLQEVVPSSVEAYSLALSLRLYHFALSGQSSSGFGTCFQAGQSLCIRQTYRIINPLYHTAIDYYASFGTNLAQLSIKPNPNEDNR